jgi:hypothetical protein
MDMHEDIIRKGAVGVALDEVNGLQQLLDQATEVLAQGDIPQARHLVECASLLYSDPRLEPILEGLVRAESCAPRRTPVHPAREAWNLSALRPVSGPQGQEWVFSYPIA